MNDLRKMIDQLRSIKEKIAADMKVADDLDGDLFRGLDMALDHVASATAVLIQTEAHLKNLKEKAAKINELL